MASTVPEVIRKYLAEEGEFAFFKDGAEIAREKKGANGHVHIEGHIPDGIVREYCTEKTDDGTQILFAEWNYRNNELEGISRIYYDNGLLEEEIDYTHGKIDLIVKKYYENGHLSFESSLRNYEGTTSLKEYAEENITALV